MTTRDRLFLIQFDRRTNRSEVEDLGHDVSSAIQVSRQRERDLAEKGIEVVLVGSASLDTLQKTHSSYFDAAAALAPVLASASRPLDPST